MSEDEPRKKGLGRGLSALLQDDVEDVATIDRMRDAREVPIYLLSPNRFQPRQDFDPDEMAELADSIRQKGILMPILVRRRQDEGDEEGFEIIAGERRWRAAQMAQLHDVPILVRDMSDTEALETAIIENVQRQDLNPIEEANGYNRLILDFGHTQAEVAKMVGKSRSHVANLVRLLHLPVQVQTLLEGGQLSAGHARSLIAAENPIAMADEILQRGLNVRGTEELTKPDRAPTPTRAPAPAEKDPNIRELEQQLSEKLGLKVAINHKGDGGEVRIVYRSLEQFDDVLARLRQHPG